MTKVQKAFQLYSFFISNNKKYENSQNSKETNPSLIGELSKGESKKSSKFRKKLSFCDYLQNCFIMCYLNSNQKLEHTPTESRNSLLMNA